MKISASILALIAFVAIFMAVLTEARIGLRLPGGMPRRPCYCRAIGCCGSQTGYVFDEEDEDVGGVLVSFL